jgi:hypothetical protein
MELRQKRRGLIRQMLVEFYSILSIVVRALLLLPRLVFASSVIEFYGLSDKSSAIILPCPLALYLVLMQRLVL